jgi:coenzyme F420 hydrogenase subunit beta
MTDVAIPPFRLRAEMNGIDEAPGKTWFFELAATVIDADRCVRCGACIAACPTDSLGVSAADLPYLVKMCTGCSLCWDFCPRGGLRYEATWHKAETAPPRGERITGVAGAGDLGAVRERHAVRVRAGSRLAAARAQDGGFVSAVLIAALESGTIDGALVAREDPATPWRAVPFLATSADELRAAAGSFYNQTLALAALDLERVGLGADARIALVGTPCEIQGIRALQRSAWRRGSSRVDAVTLTIALLCSKSFDYERLMLQSLAADRNIDLHDVAKVDVVHGRLVVQNRDGATVLDEPVKGFHGAALKGCDECADFLGRAADLSVGSVGSAQGWSSVLVRTAAGAEAFARIAAEVEMGEIERPEALEKLDALDARVAAASLQRPFDPDGALFVSLDEHLAFYEGSERAPVWQRR